MNGYTFDKETILEVEKIFMTLEKNYINKLMEIPEFYLYLQKYNSYSNENLMALFSRMQEQMENGLVKEEDEGTIELSMIACVLAMSNKIKELIKIKLPEYNTEVEKSNGRHH